MNVLIAEILVLDDAVDGSRVYRPLFSSRFSMMEEPPMNLMTKHDEPPNLESLVAELTEAAYPVALRHRQRTPCEAGRLTSSQKISPPASARRLRSFRCNHMAAHFTRRTQ